MKMWTCLKYVLLNSQLDSFNACGKILNMLGLGNWLKEWFIIPRQKNLEPVGLFE